MFYVRCNTGGDGGGSGGGGGGWGMGEGGSQVSKHGKHRIHYDNCEKNRIKTIKKIIRPWYGRLLYPFYTETSEPQPNPTLDIFVYKTTTDARKDPTWPPYCSHSTSIFSK